jgi:hypothetical protein
MASEKKSSFPAVFGGSSLLVIFAVLCLTVFALLGLSTVQAYGRIADASVAAVSDYYAADCQAKLIFAQLRSGKQPDGVQKTGDMYSYSCPISEGQVLEVEILQQEEVWHVLRWQAVSLTEVNEAGSLEVWDGELVM